MALYFYYNKLDVQKKCREPCNVYEIRRQFACMEDKACIWYIICEGALFFSLNRVWYSYQGQGRETAWESHQPNSAYKFKATELFTNKYGISFPNF